jgi:regulator of replication initiation timing
LVVRVDHLEREMESLKGELHEIRSKTDVIPVLISDNANLRAEIKWLRYTLIGFIPIMASVVVAVLRATGTAG